MTHPTALPAASRRNFLALAGAGAAVVAAAAVVPTRSAGAAASTLTGAAADAARALPAGAVAMLAHIKDVRTGEIAVMVDGREIVVTDRALVAKLAHAVAAQSA